MKAIIFSFFLIVFGCSEKKNSENSPSLTTSPDVSVAVQDDMSPDQIINAVNSGKLELKEGLKMLRAWYQTNADNGSSRSAPTMVDLVQRIKKGDPVENFAEILGTTAFGNDLQEQSKIKELFLELYKAKKKVSQANLHILFEFLNLKKRLTDNAWEFPNSVWYFIKQQRDFYKGTTEGFNIFSALSLSISSNKDFFEMILPLVADLEIGNDTPSRSLGAFERVLDEVSKRKELVLELYLYEKLLEFNSFFLKQESINQNGYSSLFKRLDWMMGFLPELEKTQKREIFFKLADRATYILQDFQLYMNRPESIRLWLKYQIQANHPLVEIYLFRTLVGDKKTAEIIAPLLPLAGEEGFMKYVERFEERALRHSRLGNVDEYTKFYHNVERDRFFLELHSKNTQESDVKAIYKDAVWNVFKANNLRHGLSFTPMNTQFMLESRLSDLSTHVKRVDNVLSVMLCNFGNDNGLCEGKDLELGPDIYLLKEPLKIYAGVIRFHPLALILAPGKNLYIRANDILFPWIDLSGGMANPDNLFLENGDLSGKNGGDLKITLDKKMSTHALLVSLGGDGHSGLNCANRCDENSTPYHGGNGGDGGRIDLTNLFHVQYNQGQISALVFGGDEGLAGSIETITPVMRDGFNFGQGKKGKKGKKGNEGNVLW